MLLTREFPDAPCKSNLTDLQFVALISRNDLPVFYEPTFDVNLMRFDSVKGLSFSLVFHIQLSLYVINPK